MNIVSNQNNKRNSTLYLTSTSNNKILYISIINDINQCFSSTYTKEDLIHINNNFNNFSSINEIHSTIQNYFQNQKDKISLNQNKEIIQIKCKDLIKGNKIIFILSKSQFESNIVTLNNEHILTIKNTKLNPYNNLQTTFNEIFNDNYTFNHILLKNDIFKSISNQNLFIFNYILSLILLLSLIIACIQYLSFPHYYTKSHILSRDDIKMISHWINPNSHFKYTLLYRASRDGDSAEMFHKLCDGKGSTLTIVSTVNGWRFGGYTQTSWQSFPDPSSWMYKSGNDIFLFSLNLKVKYPSKGAGEIFCKGIQGPTFGNGHDFAVMDKCLVSESKCNSPVSFNGLREKNEFNGGNKEFLAKEVEVYLVEVI